jgi:hypothetical protein
LLDDNKDADSKALAVLRIADKWLENAPLPAAINVRMNLFLCAYSRDKNQNQTLIWIEGKGIRYILKSVKRGSYQIRYQIFTTII